MPLGVLVSFPPAPDPSEGLLRALGPEAGSAHVFTMTSSLGARLFICVWGGLGPLPGQLVPMDASPWSLCSRGIQRPFHAHV